MGKSNSKKVKEGNVTKVQSAGYGINTNRNRLPRSVNLVQKTKQYLQLWENYHKAWTWAVERLFFKISTQLSIATN